ncbi:MAG TPA: IclR family transcriptional regulator [Longilinea sp.]|nr:IclR family transcriptional regulator [Longilinea sp.]
MKDQNDYNVRAIERALQILDCFNEEHTERSLTEIVKLVGLHKATTHRIMTTLLNSGYLEHTPDGQKFRLGLHLASLGFIVINKMDLRSEAYPFMSQLTQQLDEACDLSVFDQDHVFYVEVMQSRHTLRIAAAIGQRLPAYCTASGKLFLAFLPEPKLEAILNQPMKSHTNNTITSSALLRPQLDVIRQQGYAVDDEEYEVGIRAVAAPIRNREGSVIAAISIPSPTSRMTPDRIPAVAEVLKEMTDKVSHRMGWQI